MRRFLFHGALAVFVIAAAALLVWVLPGGYDHDLAALIDKRDLLASRRPPRIVLLGGSNLLSLRCADMEAALGRPVVNLGLFAGVPLDEFLERIGHLLVPGDTVVIVSEYPVLLGRVDSRTPAPYGDEARRFLFALDPAGAVRDAFRHGRLREPLGLFHELVQLKAKTALRLALGGRWRQLGSRGLTGYADEFTVCGSRRTGFRARPVLHEQGVSFPMPGPAHVRSVKRMAAVAAARGVVLALAFPPFPRGEYEANRDAITALETMLREVGGVVMLDRPADAVYPSSSFADTINHLNDIGEAERSKRLTELLRVFVSTPPPSPR